MEGEAGIAQAPTAVVTQPPLTELPVASQAIVPVGNQEMTKVDEVGIEESTTEVHTELDIQQISDMQAASLAEKIVDFRKAKQAVQNIPEGDIQASQMSALRNSMAENLLMDSGYSKEQVDAFMGMLNEAPVDERVLWQVLKNYQATDKEGEGFLQLHEALQDEMLMMITDAVNEASVRQGGRSYTSEEVSLMALDGTLHDVMEGRFPPDEQDGKLQDLKDGILKDKDEDIIDGEWRVMDITNNLLKAPEAPSAFADVEKTLKADTEDVEGETLAAKLINLSQTAPDRLNKVFDKMGIKFAEAFGAAVAARVGEVVDSLPIEEIIDLFFGTDRYTSQVAGFKSKDALKAENIGKAIIGPEEIEEYLVDDPKVRRKKEHQLLCAGLIMAEVIREEDPFVTGDATEVMLSKDFQETLNNAIKKKPELFSKGVLLKMNKDGASSVLSREAIIYLLKLPEYAELEEKEKAKKEGSKEDSKED